MDPAFRSQFEVAGLAPTGRYTSQLVPLLPHLFVGMLSTLASIVQLMDSALGEEARAMGLELPPWRSAGAMLSKWMPKRYSDQVRGMRSVRLLGRALPAISIRNAVHNAFWSCLQVPSGASPSQPAHFPRVPHQPLLARICSQVFVPTPVSLHPVLLAACSHNQERQWTSTAANTNTGGAGGCDGSTTSSASGSPPSPRAIQVWEDSASESGVSCCESCTSSPSSNRCQAATPVTQGYVRSVVSPAVGRCNPQQTVFGFAVSPGGTACSNSGAASPTSPFFARRTARAASALSQQLARESARARIAMPYVEKAAQQQQWEQQLFPRQARRVVCLSTVGAKHVAASVGAVL